MDYFWSFWNSLTQGFRENLAAQIIGGIVAGLAVAIVGFIATRIFLKKELPPAQGAQSAAQQSQTQQITVTVPPPQIVQPPTLPVAPEPIPRGVGAFHETPPPIPNIPPRPAIGFVARRDKEGHDLVEYVRGLLGENACVVLWGAGGIGKTALAVEIARQHERVVWASADGRPDFSLGTLLDAVVTQLGRTDLRTLALDAKTDAVRNLLAETRALSVLDNFETVVEAEQARLVEFLANAPCAVLVTSRKMVTHRRARNVEIDAMADDEAREFVCKTIAISPRREVFAGLDIAQIITTAAANPLVMEWVVAQIEQAHEPHSVFEELARGKGMPRSAFLIVRSTCRTWGTTDAPRSSRSHSLCRTPRATRWRTWRLVMMQMWGRLIKRPYNELTTRSRASSRCAWRRQPRSTRAWASLD